MIKRVSITLDGRQWLARAAICVVFGLVSVGALWTQATQAQTDVSAQARWPVIAPWADGTTLNTAAWTPVFHPSIPAHTRFTVIDDGHHSALQINAQQSYGSLVHRFDPPWQVSHAPMVLRWRWKIESQEATPHDLTHKVQDDAPLKVCVLVAVDESRLSMINRMKLAAARTFSQQPLPAATLCYVAGLFTQSAGELVTNPYTDRVKTWVLKPHMASSGVWEQESRPLWSDIQKAYGSELPEGDIKITAIAVGADTDNTHSQSNAFIADLHWERLVNN